MGLCYVKLERSDINEHMSFSSLSQMEEIDADTYILLFSQLHIAYRLVYCTTSCHAVSLIFWLLLGWHILHSHILQDHAIYNNNTQQLTSTHFSSHHTHSSASPSLYPTSLTVTVLPIISNVVAVSCSGYTDPFSLYHLLLQTSNS